jgi:hypothetical protein
MTHYKYNIHSRLLATRLIYPLLLLLVLQACTEKPKQEIDSVDRAELQELLDRVADLESVNQLPETPVMVKLYEVK